MLTILIGKIFDVRGRGTGIAAPPAAVRRRKGKAGRLGKRERSASSSKTGWLAPTGLR